MRLVERGGIYVAYSVEVGRMFVVSDAEYWFGTIHPVLELRALEELCVPVGDGRYIAESGGVRVLLTVRRVGNAAVLLRVNRALHSVSPRVRERYRGEADRLVSSIVKRAGVFRG